MITLYRRPATVRPHWDPFGWPTLPRAIAERPASPRPGGGYGAVRAHRGDDEVVFRFDVPGTAAGDVVVEVEDGSLLVRARRSDIDGSHGFERRYRLGDDVDAGSIRAELSDGVLSVTVPFAAPPAPRRIEIAVHAPSTVPDDVPDALAVSHGAGEGTDTPPAPEAVVDEAQAGEVDPA